MPLQYLRQAPVQPGEHLLRRQQREQDARVLLHHPQHAVKVLRPAVGPQGLEILAAFLVPLAVPAAAALLKTAVTGGFGGIRPWLVNGLFRREFSALELLAPAVRPYTAYLRVALILGAGLLTALWPRNTVRQMEVFRPTVRSCLTTALLAAWSIFSFTGVVTFIYSNF